MRTDSVILEEIAALKAERDAFVGRMTTAELEKANGDILSLLDELNDLLTEGAEPCPQCENMPRGMRRAKDVATLGVYEVGCVYCAPTTDEKGKRTSISARGFSIKEAVGNWNDHKWIVDYKE